MSLQPWHEHRRPCMKDGLGWVLGRGWEWKGYSSLGSVLGQDGNRPTIAIERGGCQQVQWGLLPARSPLAGTTTPASTCLQPTCTRALVDACCVVSSLFLLSHSFSVPHTPTLLPPSPSLSHLHSAWAWPLRLLTPASRALPAALGEWDSHSWRLMHSHCMRLHTRWVFESMKVYRV